MSPETHLLASWIFAAQATSNPRDCRLVVLAGILPDADGLGIAVDLTRSALHLPASFLYADYHHFLLHGLFGAMLFAGLLSIFSRNPWRVALLCLLVFHLHLLCDLLGSRGPDPTDLWGIYYLGPLQRLPFWVWHDQWRLDAWPNRWLSAVLLFWALWLAARKGYSFVGVFSSHLDRIVVPVLQKWREQLLLRVAGSRRL